MGAQVEDEKSMDELEIGVKRRDNGWVVKVSVTGQGTAVVVELRDEGTCLEHMSMSFSDGGRATTRFQITTEPAAITAFTDTASETVSIVAGPFMPAGSS